MSFLWLIIILVCGFLSGLIFTKIKLPKLIGMIIFGVILGYFSFLDDTTILIGDYLRKIALVIILTRAGLSIDLKKLKSVGRSAILMCFIPALFEILATVIFAPLLLPIDYLEALLLGSVLAAVSPAIIVPRMIKYKEEYKSDMPEVILAGSSLDDVFVITIFYSVLGLFNNSNLTSQLIQIPTSIILGIGVGLLIGLLLKLLFKKINLNKYLIVAITLTISLCLVLVESLISNYLSYQSLISILIIGLCLIEIPKVNEMKDSYNKLWIIFEIFLFVFVGATVDINLAFEYGLNSIFLLIIILTFRSIGVLVCLIKTNTTIKEKIFAVFGYLPKATVQASIGAIALANGLEIGGLILSIAVLTIIITAPLGAILLDTQTNRLLSVGDISKKI